MRISVLAAAFLLTGCAAHRPISADWRLTRQGSADLLIPPGVARADLSKRTFAMNDAGANGPCPATLRIRAKRVKLTVSRQMILSQPQGGLTTWAEDLESRGCIAAGKGSTLASRIAESLPLDPAISYRVLYPPDLVPPVRIEVVSPILHEENGSILADAPAQVSGNDSALNLTIRTSDNLIGYETAVYMLKRKRGGAGFEIVPVSAERHIQGKTESSAKPAKNYFDFGPEAAYYRLFVKSDQTEFTALMIAAPSRAELDRRTAALDKGPASCAALEGKLCVAIPRRVAINAMIPVNVNGAEKLVRWGANVGEAIRNAGERQPEAVLAKLSVSRLYDGHPTPLEFDRTSPAILRVPLMGGEVIAWN